MKNETFCFIDDIRQKKTTATGYHHRVTKKGCKLPYEYLNRKELKNLMNTPILSSNPMPFSDFSKLDAENQQKQLNLWADAYYPSAHIFAMLVDMPVSSANRYLVKNNLVFQGTRGQGVSEECRKIKTKVKFMTDLFYGKTGTPAKVEEETPEIIPEVVPETVPEVVEKNDLPVETPTTREELANPSRINFKVDGVFSSDELEIVFRSLRNASQIDPDRNYKISVTLVEI